MSEPFLGQITMFGGTFAPRGWALCDGQLLQIAQYSALYSLLGTYYGGDGRNTFGVPDLRGRFPKHWGSGPGLTPVQLGGSGGQEAVTLSVPEIPAHTHGVTGTISFGNGDNPTVYGTGVDAGPEPTANAGASQAHENTPPFQVVNFIIALQGVYPSRS